ncbi:M48 family metalloprotease [Halorubellus litoreus]|uniref:M48 family metalloprotease n=1 Tax=Halorubellus litoreus TaxID=755308 RepID=A0ABD5VKX7_9EURY
MERDRNLMRDILLTLALILAIDAVVVGVFALLAYPWLTFVHAPIAAVVGTTAAPVARWLVVFLPVLALFVWAQLRFTRQELLADVPAGDATRDTHPDLHARFVRLCKQADMQPPDLAVVDRDVPNSFAVGGVTNATVVVSEGLRDALSDDELDAVLAHELAHVKNRDATVMTLASFLPALVSDDRKILNVDGGANLLVWFVLTFVLYLLASPSLPGALFSVSSVVGFVTLVAISVLGGGIILGVLTAPVVLLSRRLSESREFVADRAGAVLVGDPSALVTALEKLSDRGFELPDTDARTHYTGVDGLCFLPYGLDDTDASTDEDTFTVETRSHPPTHERVANLRALVDEL